ncbi:hypothetical protein [Arenimonas sp.]|jgi:hypothetical protein|uniref:hypothetical protein n=1 Tax=Arenimonas sp. TaxID=1872635 RepID=UPI0037BEAB0B
MSAVEMIVAGLATRRDYLADKLAHHRDAFTSIGIASLEQQIADLDDEIALTTGAQR